MFCSKCSISPVRVPELSPSGAQLSEWHDLFAHCLSSKEFMTLPGHRSGEQRGGLPCPHGIRNTSFPLWSKLSGELPEGETAAQAG